ncbi:MAG: metallophosphoesterase [Candidatus Woesearchaeota archaeon]
MRREAAMVAITGVFMAVYAGLNYFVISCVFDLVGLNGMFRGSLTAFFTIAFPLATVIERSFPNRGTRMLYAAAAFWIGVLLFLGALFAVYKLASVFIRIPDYAAGAAILSAAALLAAYSAFNASKVEVRRVRTGISARIVQLSDLHIGTVRKRPYLEKIVRMTNSLKPDVVAITGDFIDGTAPLNESLFVPLRKIRAPVLFVTGNHEIYEGEDKVKRLLRGVTVLDNTSKRIKGVQFTGVGFKKNLRTKAKGNAVLLRHTPAGMKETEKAGFRLQLSGHTHNGQIFPFNLIVKLFFPKVKGLYRIGRLMLYTSPGTGTWGPYMRLGSRNEITLFRK